MSKGVSVEQRFEAFALGGVLFRVCLVQFQDVLQLPLNCRQVCCGGQADDIAVWFAIDQRAKKLFSIADQAGLDVLDESDPHLLQLSDADRLDGHAEKLSLEDACQRREVRVQQFMLGMV